MTSEPGPRVSYREVFGIAEFRALYTVHTLSSLSNQLARVALAVLVFGRTGSASLTAVTYALTFIPDLVGGPLLAGLADRYPRRAVLVLSGLGRAALVAPMAVPGAPFPVLCLLLICSQLLNAPFSAARAALMPAILGEDDRYVVGSAAMTMTNQLAQLVGFGAGGVLVAAIGTNPALLSGAGLYAAAGLAARYGLRARGAPGDATRSPWWATLRAGAGLVWGRPDLRLLVAFGCVSGFIVPAEALAVPYSGQIGGGPATAGLLLAALPLGGLAGMWLVTQAPAPRRLQLLGPMAALSCLPLASTLAAPPAQISIALWVLAGLGGAYQLIASAEFVRRVPDAARGQAFGLATTALQVSQGAGVLAAGVAAAGLAPNVVIAAAGVAGTAAAATINYRWRRSRTVPSG